MTLTWNGKRFDWVNVGWFAALHAGALLAPWTFTWTGLGARPRPLVALRLDRDLPDLPPPADPPRLPRPEAARVPRDARRHAGERGRRDLLGGHAPHPPREVRPAGRGPPHAEGRLLVEPHRLGALQGRPRTTASWSGAGPPSSWPTRCTASSTASTGCRTSRSASPSTPGAAGRSSSGASSCACCSRCTAPGSSTPPPTPGATAPGRRRRTRATSGGWASWPGARAGTTRTTPSSARPATASAGSST